MVKRYGQFLMGMLAGLILGIFIAKTYLLTPVAPALPAKSSASSQTEHPASATSPLPDESKKSSPDQAVHSNSIIPQKVFNVLNYIQLHHAAMDGYVGGRVFSNRERMLPLRSNQNSSIQYQEWDVNPKVQGQNRDAERIVTGSDGRSWYSNDHYKSFTEIK